MMEFQIRTYRKSMEDVPQDIRDAFRTPIVLTMVHKKNTTAFFPSFVIIDFTCGELTHIRSYLPENVVLKKAHPENASIVTRPHMVNPHCIIEVHPGKDFYAFVDGGNYFLHVDYVTGKMRTYFAKDVLADGDLGNFGWFSATAYKDDDDPRFFHFAVESRQEEKRYLDFCRMSLDRSDARRVFRSDMADFFPVPHAVRKFRGRIFNSRFEGGRFRYRESGKMFDSIEALSEHIYRGLHREFCALSGGEMSERRFEDDVTSFYPETDFSSDFQRFCEDRGGNIVGIGRRDNRYVFEALPGIFLAINLGTGSLERYETTFCSPAHFEADERDDALYVSSHNFLRFGKKMLFLGPAALDKFVIRDGGVKRVGSFSDPSGYRFTSHKIFYHRGHSYICTIGHPNRLFIIDAETMELVYHVDLFRDSLSSISDIGEFVNQYDGPFLSAVEVSDDGEYIIVIGSSSIYFFSVIGRRIIYEMPIFQVSDTEYDKSYWKFVMRTVHMNRLT